MPPDAPLPNDPASRTPTGEIKAPETTTESTEQPKLETKIESTTEPKTESKVEGKEEDKSLLNKKDDAKPEGAPEKYEPFKAPEGMELDEPVVAAASELFKKYNLPQAAAQELVDFYTKQQADAAKAPLDYYANLRKEWRDEVSADPKLGPRQTEIRQNLGKMLAAIGDAKLEADFRMAMDFTGAGDHPAFIRLIDKIAPFVIEGKPVRGGGPSTYGQKAPGEKPISAANALYPNLPA